MSTDATVFPPDAKDQLIAASLALGAKQAETEVKLGARIVELLEENKVLKEALERCRFYAEDGNSAAVILIVKTALNPSPDRINQPRFSDGLSPLETIP